MKKIKISVRNNFEEEGEVDVLRSQFL